MPHSGKQAGTFIAIEYIKMGRANGLPSSTVRVNCSRVRKRNRQKLKKREENSLPVSKQAGSSPGQRAARRAGGQADAVCDSWLRARSQGFGGILKCGKGACTKAWA